MATKDVKSGSQEAGDVLKQRNRGLGILLLRVLSENPAIGNKGRQPLRQPRGRVFLKTG